MFGPNMKLFDFYPRFQLPAAFKASAKLPVSDRLSAVPAPALEANGLPAYVAVSFLGQVLQVPWADRWARSRHKSVSSRVPFFFDFPFSLRNCNFLPVIIPKLF